MTHQSIYISDQGELLLIDAPEKPKLLEDFSERLPMLTMQYEAALASAIAKGVKFKDNQATLKILIGSIFKTNVVDKVHPNSRFIEVNKGKIFPLPTGYKVSFEYQIKSIFSDDHWNTISDEVYNHYLNNGAGFIRKLAILSKLEEEKVAPVYTGGLEGITVKKSDMVSGKFPSHNNFTGPSEEPVVTFKDCVFESVAPSEEVKMKPRDEDEFYKFLLMEIIDYERLRDGFKLHTNQHAAYSLMVKQLQKVKAMYVTMKF